jgi:hypothetical protein
MMSFLAKGWISWEPRHEDTLWLILIVATLSLISGKNLTKLCRRKLTCVFCKLDHSFTIFPISLKGSRLKKRVIKFYVGSTQIFTMGLHCIPSLWIKLQVKCWCVSWNRTPKIYTEPCLHIRLTTVDEKWVLLKWRFGWYIPVNLPFHTFASWWQPSNLAKAGTLGWSTSGRIQVTPCRPDAIARFPAKTKNILRMLPLPGMESLTYDYYFFVFRHWW